MSTKTVHQCSADGWYIGDTEAHESPLEPGVFHIPAGCVEVEPPAADDPARPRWVAGSWVLQVPPAQTSHSPAEVLAAFLAANPAVSALINGASPTSSEAGSS